jgi:hypothetical protein
LGYSFNLIYPVGKSNQIIASGSQIREIKSGEKGYRPFRGGKTNWQTGTMAERKNRLNDSYSRDSEAGLSF